MLIILAFWYSIEHQDFKEEFVCKIWIVIYKRKHESLQKRI